MHLISKVGGLANYNWSITMKILWNIMNLRSGVVTLLVFTLVLFEFPTTIGGDESSELGKF